MPTPRTRFRSLMSGRCKGKIMKSISVLALAAASLLVACGGDSRTVTDRERASDTETTSSTIQQNYEAAGEVTARSTGSITIAHGPVAELAWPAMTMELEASDPAMVDAIAVGDRINFGFRDSETGYVLTSLARIEQ